MGSKRSVLVSMLIFLAIGTSFGYFLGTTGTTRLAPAVTVTKTKTVTVATTVTKTTAATLTLSAQEISGSLFLDSSNAVYRLDMRPSAKPVWQLFLNKTLGDSKMEPSPDGRHVIFSDADSQIHLIDLGTGERRVLSRHGSSTGISCLSWSPDGSRIAYQTRAETGGSVNYVLDLSGKTRMIDRSRPPQTYTVIGHPGQTAKVLGGFGCPTWAGANLLLYQRFRGPWPQTTLLSCYYGVVCSGFIQADTTTAVTVTKDGVRLRNLPERWFAQVASSNTALVREGDENGRLFLANSSDLEAARANVGIQLEFCNGPPAVCPEMHFSPDARQVAILLQSASRSSVELIDVKTPQKRTTIAVSFGIVSGFKWALNGREIALVGTALTVLDLATKQERMIVAASKDLQMREPVWIGSEYLAVVAATQTGPPQGARSTLCIVRVADGASYLLPSVSVAYPEILSWQNSE